MDETLKYPVYPRWAWALAMFILGGATGPMLYVVGRHWGLGVAERTLIVVSGVCTVTGSLMAAARDPAKRKAWLVCCLVAATASIGWFVAAL